MKEERNNNSIVAGLAAASRPSFPHFCACGISLPFQVQTASPTHCAGCKTARGKSLERMKLYTSRYNDLTDGRVGKYEVGATETLLCQYWILLSPMVFNFRQQNCPTKGVDGFLSSNFFTYTVNKQNTTVSLHTPAPPPPQMFLEI